jgi:hypothetical protein
MKAGRQLVVGFGLGLWIAWSAAAGPLYDWNYRMKIKFTGYTGEETLTNFPVLAVLKTDMPGFSYALFSDPVNGGDMRFCDTNNTILNHEIELWNSNGSSYVWVQVPSIASSNDFIWAYFGGPDTNPPPSVTNGATWSQGYRGVWHLGGNEATDSTSNRLDGKVYGCAGITGIVGTARNFDGNDYVGLGTGTNPLQGMAAFSVSWWMYETSHQAGAQISSDPYPASTNRFILQDNYPNFQPLYADGRVFSNCNYHIDGRWHFYSLTVASVSGGTWSFYVDGVMKGSTNWNFVAGNFEMQFGKHETAYFIGGLDEIRLSAAVRSPEWVQACYMNGASNSMFNSYGQVQRILHGTCIMIR